MQISSLLLKPYLEQLCREFQLLSRAVVLESHSELDNLQLEIQNSLDEIRQLQGEVARLSEAQMTRVPASLYENYKKLKLSLRFSQRSLKRFISNQERIRKMQERKNHVAVFAA